MKELEFLIKILSNTEYIDIHEFKIAFKVWENLKLIYDTDNNVQRDGVDSLKVKYDYLNMVEGENVAQYGQRIKQVVGSSISVDGTIEEEEEVVSKIMRTFLPSYSIRVSSIY